MINFNSEEKFCVRNRMIYNFLTYLFSIAYRPHKTNANIKFKPENVLFRFTFAIAAKLNHIFPFNWWCLWWWMFAGYTVPYVCETTMSPPSEQCECYSYSRTHPNSVKDNLSYIALSHIAMYGQIGYLIDIKDILYLSRTPTQLPSTNK